VDSGKNIKGNIFDIERFAVHDGPGIRTLVFLKGCPLKCLWCANPEGQYTNQQLIFMKDKCINCKKCIAVCPQKAIRILNDNIVQDWERCINCFNCVKVCPVGSRQIKGYRCTAEDVVEEVIKDISFYRRSGGGITLSGVNPVIKIDFSSEILKLCKENNIHTAIETSGYTKWSNFLKITKFTDFIYVDIKHMDSVKHKLYTGVDNNIILANIEKISKLGKPFIIRVPVVTGYNDSNYNILETSRFAKNLDNLVGIELLPYHKLGEYKYKYLGMNYLLENVSIPSSRKMKYLVNLIKSQGMKCIINK